MKQLIIIGASGHGKVVADVAKKNGYEDIFFLDDNEALTECGGYPVVGKCCSFIGYNCNIFVAIGNPEIRERFLNEILNAGKNVPTLIHPSASVEENVSIGKGTLIVAGAVINPGTIIGKGCIINTCASVDHDCTVSDFVHVSVGAHIAGTVQIGTRTWVGAGATVINNIRICSNCIIGAGAVVVNDIDVSGTYVGVPSRKL